MVSRMTYYMYPSCDHLFINKIDIIIVNLIKLITMESLCVSGVLYYVATNKINHLEFSSTLYGDQFINIIMHTK